MSAASILTLLFGLLTGLSLGALGSGGSILALPAFVYAAGVPTKSAVATSLAVVGATSLVGGLMAWRRCARGSCSDQKVDGRVALLFAAGGLVGSFAGARLARWVPDSAQMLLFAIAVIAAAVGMLRRSAAPGAGPAPADGPGRALFVPAVGLAVGLLTGLIGVGGGFLIVPALTLLAGVPVKRAIPTSLWIIAANSSTAVLGYVGRVPFAWATAALFLAAAVLGMLAGLHVSRAARPVRLQRAFALFLVVVGVFTMAQTLLRRSRPAPPPAAAVPAASREASRS